MNIPEVTRMTRESLPKEGKTEVSFDEASQMLDTESTKRPRVYGLLNDGRYGQIVAIKSQWMLDKYADNLLLLWISNSERTMYDLIRKA